MALPTNLAAKFKSIPMDPTVLATNLELAYLLSFANHPMTNDSICLYPRESYQSPLQHYQFADFEDETYDQLLQETLKNYKQKNKQVAKGIRCGFKEFYARVAANTANMALKYMSREKPQSEKKLQLPKEDEQEYRIQKLKGNNPAKWPETTKQFVKDVNNLPWHAFSSDAQIMFNDFVESAKNAIITLCQKSKLVDGKFELSFKQNLILEIQAFLGVVLRTNNQSFILEQLKFVSELGRYVNLDQQNQAFLCQKVSAFFKYFFQNIPKGSSQKYHSPGSLWSLDPFVIMKKIHFQKYPGLAYYSIATDGNYLYFYVSAVNGGMFKIGTGNGGTKAGKVYNEKLVHFPIGTKVDQVSWVYLKEKLYLKTSSKDAWFLQVISPTTFEKVGNVQLFCPSLFGHQSLINLNKNSPLLTDGNSLYILGNRIKICKSEAPEKKPVQEKPKESDKAMDEKRQLLQKKKLLKKKAAKKGQQGENVNPPEENKNQNFQKILQIVLFQFSVDGVREYNDEGIDERDVDSLVEQFSGYFTKNECRRALALNNNDIAETCQWLFNEGEKEKQKNIKILDASKCVILVENQITSNFQEKAIKGPTQITSKQGSILSIQNLYESIWTMDKDQITCYSENGLKIFSKDMKDSKKNPETKLSTTLLKILDAKFPRNPECNVIYDPYGKLFFTFGWPQEGHYFPTGILVSSDRKNSPKVQKPENEITNLTTLTQVQKYSLQYMCSLQRGSLQAKYKFNDWLWYYGQRVIEIGNEMNAADSDKKRLSNKRAKVMIKMNKINQQEKRYQKGKASFDKFNKVIKQIVKIYPFQAEGTMKSYRLINQAFHNLQNDSQEVYVYVRCWENWLNNCSIISEAEIKQVLLEVGEKMMNLKQKSTSRNRELINKLLIQEFYLFFPTLEKQIQFIISMDCLELEKFVKSQWKNQKKDKESIVYQLTKKQQIVQKYQTNKCNFADIFKSQQNISINDVDKVELLGNLLLSDVLEIQKQKLLVKGKYDEGSRKLLLVYIQEKLIESDAGRNLVQFLFLTSLKMLKTNPKDSQLSFKYQTELFVEVLKLFQKTFQRVKTTYLFTLLPTLLMIVEVYHGSLVSVHPNQQIISSLLKITEYIQRPELSQIHKYIVDCQYEGISATTEKIYETSHPLQRGKNYNFPPRRFNNASLILLDLDKRCQSDPNNDNLNLQIIHEDSAVGNNIQINDGVFSSNIRLSGAVDTKKMYMLFGKAATIDFTSSGHVKDVQSLVRFGFKFGLRPIFTGRNNLQDGKKNKVIKLFQNMQNFQSYFNTLKFLAVVSSDSIEKYLQMQNEISDPQIDDLLKSKIFKQGFEQHAFKQDYQEVNAVQVVDNFMRQTNHESADKNILRNSQQLYWCLGKQKVEQPKSTQGELWNFEGIPAYIKTYLQQIKEFKGNFIDVFTGARELAKEKGTYAQILKRKIVQQHKSLWLQGQAILFLTILKHSGLLHLNLKFSIQYIKQNLKAFEDARDGIYNSFISRIQYVNEWRHLIQTYIRKDEVEEEQIEEKKEEPQLKKPQPSSKGFAVKGRGRPGKIMRIPEKVEGKKEVQKKEKVEQKPKSKFMDKAKFEKQVRERLSNESLIKGICKIRKIKFDDQYDTVTRIIDELVKAAEGPIDLEEKAYSDPIEHLIRCCLFLLKFKSPSTKESLSENENIVPVGMMRSLSEGSRNCDTNKVNIFREWLQNWKNWKGFKKEGNVELQFPIEEIVRYINSWRDLDQIKRAISKRYLKCHNRIQFYTHCNQLLRLFSQSKIVKYALGSQIMNISKHYSSDLESISTPKRKQLQEVYSSFKESVKLVETSLISQLPLTLQKVQQGVKEGSFRLLDKIKLTLHSIFLLECQNPEIDLNTLLFVLTFKFLSSQQEDLIYISTALLQRGFIGKHSNEEIVDCLKRQIGDSSISYKRWKDFFFAERVLFLLRKLEMNLKRQPKVTADAQIQIAESIFNILYHIEVPLIAKLGLKILKKLKISLKQGIKTPFDLQYKLYKPNAQNQLQLKQTFKLSRNARNNITLLCAKINDIFDTGKSKELALKFEGKQEIDEEDRFNIILNLHQEEDLYWMIKVLYYIDEFEIKKGEKTIKEIKDFDQYLQLKNKKKEGQKKDGNQANQVEKDKKQIDRNERIFSNLPKGFKVNSNLEKELPVGWFFNYCDIFANPLQKVESLQLKKTKAAANPAAQNAQKNQKPNKNNQNNQNNNKGKGWATPIFTKLSKKYQQFNTKPPEQPKPEDTAQLKADFVKAKNIFNRMKRYFAQVALMMDNFQEMDISRMRMNQLCQMMTAGSMNRLKDIEIDLTNNDVKARLLINDFVPNFVSKLKISIIKNKDYAYFNNLLIYQSVLASRGDQNNSYYPLLVRKQLTFNDSKSFMPYEHFLPFDQSPDEEPDIQFGKQWIQANFSRMKKKYEKVYLSDYPSQTFYISQGGVQSGIRETVLIPADDSNLTQQTAPLQKIMTAPKVQLDSEYEQTQLPQELVEKINKILEKGSIQISKKEDIREYLLLTFYLKKLTNYDLSYGDSSLNKQFAKKLFKYTEHLKSYKQLSVYQQQCQKLIIKLVDNQHQKLHIFGTYIHDDQYDEEIEEYQIPFKLQKLNSSNQVKQESLKTHSCIKSKYLLDSQPPQIQQNKLLKYWEKNILPRILGFVQTTLKPLEVQDFWEQMRRPLRVGDHTQAKRVAYIICDNKLPAGAILPDSNHNWNSLQIQQIFVGENVLIKVPKGKGEFCTPLLGWGNHEQRLGKIVFVDVKSSSVLVRYRLQQLSLFSYSWVPINALMAVEKQVMHISTKSIYQQLNKSLQGMVYIYAKECLTKLASSVSDRDNLKLIRETILDMFIKNPISGSFSFPKPKWSMRGVFQKMLQDGNLSIVQILQKDFCSIKGIDLNLNSEKMTELNRFDDAKALIVSFKREAKLAVCSGVRFYSDKFGYKQISHVYTAKGQRTDMEPIQFNQPNIYCRYYTNKECLPILEQSNYKVHHIEATIFAVDEMWTIGCYIGEVVCQIASNKGTKNYIEILRRINVLFLKWLGKKSVSILCSYLAKLIAKVSLTIASICLNNKIEIKIQTLGASVQQITEVLTWIGELMEEESKEKVVLYSSLLQNLSEMVASIVVNVPQPFPQIHQHIKSSIDLMKIFKEIDSFSKTKKISLFPPSPPANYQWERILQISNIPAYISEETIYKKMSEIIKNAKGKILCPKLDIFQKDGICYILVDGWDINQLIEEEVMEKMEQEVEEEHQDQIANNGGGGGNESIMLEWDCAFCTYHNPGDANMCQICQSPAPVAAKQEELYDQVEATDLKEAERKLRQKEAKRFGDVKVQILKFFDDQYKSVCDLVQKKNQEEEDAKKNQKNKKGVKEEAEQAKQIPKKPEIKLQTGSSVFQKPEIDVFLKARLEQMPEQLAKLVSDEQTYIGKFKRLLNLGYDLWGDNTNSQNSTLIPFSSLYWLMDYIQIEICKGSSSVLSYSEDSIRILSQIPWLQKFNEEPINYNAENDIGVRVKYKLLADFKSYNIRQSWKFVKELNLAASKCLQLINMDFKFDKERNDTGPVYNDCLGYKIKYYRNLIFGVIKLELFQKIMQKTSVSRQNDDVPKITLERLKVREEKVRAKIVTPKEKEDHLFTKANDQFLKISSAFLRPFKPKGADPYVSFTVNFKGQNVMGQAGPYRQFFTDIVRELHPSYALGLFVPSPNNHYQSGEHKSKWVINPKANSTYHFSLFQFVGTLMGCCFRTGSHLALDLPTMFWKALTHEEVTDQDLDEVDSQLMSFITMLKKCPSRQEFQVAMEYTSEGQLTWSFKGFDDDTHEMFYNGKNTKVQFEDLPKYLQQLKWHKINQTKLQIKRILHGLSQLIPLPYLHCLSGEELKLIICGRPKVDVDLLKKHTKYSGGLNDESRRIVYFWEVMRELPETERLKIIKFCWGQERLPMNSQQFQRNNIRFMIKPMITNIKKPDEALPKADTCFFNIDLPDYSTKEIMRKNILLAINLDCDSINADENIYNEDNGLMNEINTYGEDNYEEGDEENW